MSDSVETVWGVIANIGGRDWTMESKWQEVAAKFCEAYCAPLARTQRPTKPWGVDV